MASRVKLYTRFRGSSSKDTEESQSKLNVIIYGIDMDLNRFNLTDRRFQVKIFIDEEIDYCVDHITTLNTPVYLFISNKISYDTIKLICEIPQITSIYIFASNDVGEHVLDEDFKIKRTFNNKDFMFRQFEKDMNGFDYLHYSGQSSLRSVDYESAEIVWWLIFHKILERIHYTNVAKDEFVEFSIKIYRDNRTQLIRIAQFNEDYTAREAILWYTRNSFVCRIINSTLRRHRLDDIFKCRLMIRDIMVELKADQLQQFDRSSPSFMVVYGGQIIRSEELKNFKNNIGGFIFITSFLSTFRSFVVARAFVESQSTLPAGFSSALFTIVIDSNNITDETPPIADISCRSSFPVEREVLFAPHSMLRVDEVELCDDEVWHIHLTVANRKWDMDFGERSIFSPHADEIFIRHLSKENKQFIGFQILLDTILRLEQNKYSKIELVEFCQTKYVDEPTSMKQIDDFQYNYRSEDAAKWYTKTGFLYRLLNKSLRIENIDHIVKMRYYIHDLHNQLAELQPTFIQSLIGQTNLILFRGQIIKLYELKEIQENEGGFISMNSFISASEDLEVARMFSGYGKNLDLDEVSVIYEMAIDTNIRSTPYAKIDTVNPDEEEILFSMGAIFCIGHIDKSEDKIYSIKLTMTHIEDGLWNKLTAHLN